MKYFAYGSNMSSSRLLARTPGARQIGVHFLYGHELRFHKAGHDGSAKCDAYFTDNTSHVVEGVVYDIEPHEIALLDRIEGVGNGYEKKEVTVVDSRQRQQPVFMYFATDIDASLLPFCWYKHHVVTGARQAGLSHDYTSRLEQLAYQSDPDPYRKQREESIHRTHIDK